MIRDILTYPDKRLNQISKNVIDFDNNLHILLDDMYETMIANNGVGLAAIQIGVALNILIINPTSGEEGEQLKEDLVEAINPKITYSEGEQVYNEGCLSVPKYYFDITRAKKIIVEYYDRYGTQHTATYEDFMAVAWQHELDHLSGRLFIEKLSIIKRKKFEKEIKKQVKGK